MAAASFDLLVTLPSGATTTAHVTPSTTVADVKAQLAAKHAIPAAAQSLAFAGTPAAADTATMADVLAADGTVATLTAADPAPIAVEFAHAVSGTSFSATVSPLAPLASVAERIDDDLDVMLRELALTYDGVALANLDDSFAAAGIVDGATVAVACVPHELAVTLLFVGGAREPFSLFSSDTGADAVAKVAAAFPAAPPGFRLFAANYELEPDRPLREYRFDDGANLTVAPPAST